MDTTFKILRKPKIEELEKDVSDCIGEGFEPHGDLLIREYKNGEETAYLFIQAMKKLPKKASGFKKEVDVIGKCPACGGDLSYSKTGYIKCENKSCEKGFFKYFERLLTRDEAKALFAGETIEIDKVKKKDGSFGNAKIKLAEKHEGKWFAVELIKE